MKEFYYSRRKLRHWFLISLLILLISLSFSAVSSELVFLNSVVKLIALCFFCGMLYVYVWPQRLAKIDDEGIIIDRNAKLKWSDIAKVEHFNAKCCCGRSFIRFKLKKNAQYRLRLMQKISATSKYGAFSIPLYAMTKQDATAIEKEITKHMSVPAKIKSAVKRVFKVSKKSMPKAKNKKAAK